MFKEINEISIIQSLQLPSIIDVNKYDFLKLIDIKMKNNNNIDWLSYGIFYFYDI